MFEGADLVSEWGRPRCDAEKSGRGVRKPSGVQGVRRVQTAFCTETGRSRRSLYGSGVRHAAAGGRRAASRSTERREGGRRHNTKEASEDEGNARRASGGKAYGQGKIRCRKRMLDTA